MKTRLYILILSLGLIASACAATPSATKNITVVTPLPTSNESNTESQVAEISTTSVYYTYPSKDGNHFIEGVIDMQNTTPLMIPTNGVPQWVVGGAYLQGTLWVVALTSGEVQAFYLHAGDIEELGISTMLAPGEPPALAINQDQFLILQENYPDRSLSTHLIITNTGDFVYIDHNGAVQYTGSNNQKFSISLNALPDARLIETSDGRILLYTAPTTRYDHGIAGDEFEAGGFALISQEEDRLIISETLLPEEIVIEGVFPLWSDLNGDGQEEIIVTHSGYGIGAQLAVYDDSGELLATSDAIGKSYRWRHQIAVAPFGPSGEIELVDILTPHLGGVVEFFQWQGDALIRVAFIEGFTSHRSGTRNMDMAMAGDFDGDGIVELLLPSQQLNSLGAIQRTETGAIVDWEIQLEGIISSNLSAVQLEDGTIAIGLGLEDNKILIWSP